MAENLVVLCRTCHTRLEGHETGWERVAAAVRVYVLTNRGRCVYVVEKIGWDRFSARYPLLSAPDAGVALNVPFATASGAESDEPTWRYRPPEEELESESVEGYPV